MWIQTILGRGVGGKEQVRALGIVVRGMYGPGAAGDDAVEAS